MKRFLDGNVKSGQNLKASLDNNNSSNKVKTNRFPGAALSDGDLDLVSLRDLIHLEQQFHGYLRRVRARKGELLLEQLQNLKEQVTKAPRSANLESSTDSGLSKTIAFQNSGTEGDSKHCYPHEPLLRDGSPSLWSVDLTEASEQTNQDPPAAKRYQAAIKYPACMRGSKGKHKGNDDAKVE